MSYALDLDWDRNYSAAISAWNKYGESLGLSLMERQFSTAKEPEGNWYVLIKTCITLLINLLSSKVA